MHRWTLALALTLTACSAGDGTDTGSDTTPQCGSTMAFVSGTVDGATGDQVTVAADNGTEQVEADWYGERDGLLAYELNLPAGDWEISAAGDGCASETQALSASACQEYTVDLTASCR